MKTFNTILLILLILFLLSFAVFEIFDLSVDFSSIKISNKRQGQDNNSETQETNINTETQTPDTNPFNLPPEGINQLMAQILQAGSGEEVVAGDKITVHYSGYLSDGTKFDSSLDRGQPFQLTIGIGQVIPGWDQGVVGMQVGETRRLLIPSNLGYGEQGVSGVIPPNSGLIFDVQLISIDEKAEIQPGIQEDNQEISEPLDQPQDNPISDE